MVTTILLRDLTQKIIWQYQMVLFFDGRIQFLFIILFDLLYIFLHELVYNSHNLRNLVIISIIIANELL